MTEREVLQERAQVLAKVVHRPAQVELVAFRVADSPFCVEPAALSGVHPLTGLTPLPGAPAWVAGLQAVRGTVLSLVWMADWLGLQGRRPERGHVLVVSGPEGPFGFVVDAVLGTVSVNEDALVPDPQGRHRWLTPLGPWLAWESARLHHSQFRLLSGGSS